MPGPARARAARSQTTARVRRSNGPQRVRRRRASTRAPFLARSSWRSMPKSRASKSAPAVARDGGNGLGRTRVSQAGLSSRQSQLVRGPFRRRPERIATSPRSRTPCLDPRSEEGSQPASLRRIPEALLPAGAVGAQTREPYPRDSGKSRSRDARAGRRRIVQCKGPGGFARLRSRPLRSRAPPAAQENRGRSRWSPLFSGAGRDAAGRYFRPAKGSSVSKAARISRAASAC